MSIIQSGNKRIMNKTEIVNRIEYVICCVGAFAEKFNISNADAYAYLNKYGAVNFLIDCYAAEHTLSIDNAVEDMKYICLKKGGDIS